MEQDSFIPFLITGALKKSAHKGWHTYTAHVRMEGDYLQVAGDNLTVGTRAPLQGHCERSWLYGFAWGIAAVACTIFLLVSAERRADAAKDELARIKEQYRDCMMVGDYPTKADMGTEETGQ